MGTRRMRVRVGTTPLQAAHHQAAVTAAALIAANANAAAAVAAAANWRFVERYVSYLWLGADPLTTPVERFDPAGASAWEAASERYARIVGRSPTGVAS